jgi:organic hydroperoxide reductase OsmC/OhrA
LFESENSEAAPAALAEAKDATNSEELVVGAAGASFPSMITSVRREAGVARVGRGQMAGTNGVKQQEEV